ncbi:MAG: NUDIX domain-containing protein [Chloroflexi bacterium]|nr:NUDIX domain-containing protein [Chloroflexota bacterium]
MWNGIVVAVGAVVQDDLGRVLLVKHVPERGGFWQGKWICPGGRLHAGEPITEGIKREVKEETGLDIELGRPLVPFERIVTDHGKTMHVIYVDYLATSLGRDATPASDVGEATWVRRDGLPGMWPELHEDTQRLMTIAGLVE